LGKGEQKRKEDESRGIEEKKRRKRGPDSQRGKCCEGRERIRRVCSKKRGPEVSHETAIFI